MSRVRVVNIVPKVRSGETQQDSEPNLAVNPINPQQMVASAFTPDPLGGANAPIYFSTDGGQTWTMNSIVPGNSTTSGTGDITVRFGGSSGILYAGTLRGGSGLRLNILRTGDFTSTTAMTVLVDRNGSGVDQPYVQATTVGGNDRVYVGDNDFNAAAGQTASMDRSLNAGTAAPPAGMQTFRLCSRAHPSANQDGPPIRPAVHADGTVYAAFYHWTAFTGSLATADVVVVRDDNAASGANPFQDLVDTPSPPGDGNTGRRVVTDRSVPFNLDQALGQERLVASNITIAIDPRNSSRVYLAWADEVSGVYTLHARRSTDQGVTWSADLRTIGNATNPALALNDRGQVGFLYQALVGSGASQRWQTHFERRTNDFDAIENLVLANVPANAPTRIFGPYLGDYVHLLAVGSTFYGIFSANNTPDTANFPNGVTYQRNANFNTKTLLAVNNTTPVAVSIDPFFFSVQDPGYYGFAEIAMETGIGTSLV
jgi:hypothetical protein